MNPRPINNLIARWEKISRTYKGVNDDKARQCEAFVEDLKKLKRDYGAMDTSQQVGLFGENIQNGKVNVK